jgi:hypothetical protein
LPETKYFASGDIFFLSISRESGKNSKARYLSGGVLFLTRRQNYQKVGRF